MLIDTSGFFCLYNEDEDNHDEALEHYDKARIHITTNYILAEYVALALIRGSSRRDTIEFSQRILYDDEVKIVWVDEDLHRRAIELLQKRTDKTYSLCDAVSFIIMRERGINEALTTDKHFEQENFVRLLKP
jgi:predicted nucleic acid-binding protein